MAYNSRWRALASCLIAALIAWAACVLAPLRPQGTDTVASRAGAVALACKGSFDLLDIDWLADMASKGQVPYYGLAAEDGRMVSAFGRAPAILGAAAMSSLEPGARVTDRDLRRLSRYAAAAAIALAAALACLTLLTVAPPWLACVASAAVAVSCAGCATIGQALWQQTAALPFFLAALACLAWGPRRPWLLVMLPALIATALLLRPPTVGLCLGLGLGGWLALRPYADRARVMLWSLPLVALATMPLMLANLSDFGSPLPAGQAITNIAMAPDGAVFSVAPGRWLPALAGLLVSPGRGLLWYAPILLLGLGRVARGPATVQRAVAIGIAAHIAFTATFFRWTGGVTFGPRLLAESIWVAPWLALSAGAAAGFARRMLLGVALAWTAAVGLLGLWRFDPRLWELRHLDEPAALWQVVDSPLGALLTRPMPRYSIGDAPPGPFRYCQPRPLQPWTP